VKSDLLDHWPELVSALVAAVDSEWSRGGPLHHWRKGDSDQLVSDLDLRLDVAIRTTLSGYYPRLPVLSEELGWLHPDERASTQRVAVVDPVDGTDSLVEHRDSWWTSVALLEAGVPRAGVVYQPTTGVIHDSQAPRDMPPASGAIGLSPDQFEASETPALRRSEGLDGFAIVPVPHAVEKVAAVVEGRCDASLFLPSRKSPGWNSKPASSSNPAGCCAWEPPSPTSATRRTRSATSSSRSPFPPTPSTSSRSTGAGAASCTRTASRS